MKEEDVFPAPPEPPPPSAWQRLSASPYFWWFAAIFLMGCVVFLFPSQCTFEAIQFPTEKRVDLDQSPFVDQEKELSMAGDGLWYKAGETVPYSGLGVTFHPNGEKKTRTQFAEGIAVGLIEEWDLNGSNLGPRFKGEFSPE